MPGSFGLVAVYNLRRFFFAFCLWEQARFEEPSPANGLGANEGWEKTDDPVQNLA